MLHRKVRHVVCIALAGMCLPGFAAESAAPKSLDQALVLQSQRELTLARLAMSQGRPDIACQALKPGTAPDNADTERLLLLGRCSAGLGQSEDAAAYYRRVIALNPQAAEPRMELARLYAATGQREAAAQLFTEAAANNGDSEGAALMKSIAERLRTNDPATLAAQQQKPWSLQLYAGVLYDDNANGGPVSRNVPAILGGVPISFELVPEAMPRSSYGAALGLTGTYLAPINQSWAVLWQGAYFGTGYFSEQDFNNDSLSLAAAFIYRNQGFNASIQPNLRYSRLDGRVQEQTPGVTARASQKVSPTVALTGSLGYFDRSMPAAHERDAQAWFTSFGASWQALNVLQLGGEYVWQDENAEVDIYSRRSNGPSLFATYQASATVSLLANYTYSKSDYEEAMALFPEPRSDTQKVATLTALWDVSAWAGRNMVVRAQYTNIDNPSNIAYNSFRRNIASVGVQMMF